MGVIWESGLGDSSGTCTSWEADVTGAPGAVMEDISRREIVEATAELAGVLNALDASRTFQN